MGSPRRSPARTDLWEHLVPSDLPRPGADTRGPFVTGRVDLSAEDAVRRLADLTRGRESLQQLPGFAAQLLGTSSAHVALISDVQEVQGGVGLGAAGVGLATPPQDSICSVTVDTHAVTAIDDTVLDPRVVHMPPVASGRVRAYLGVPLEVRGVAVGALCVFDESPRSWTQADADLLQGLAAPILAELELAAVAIEHDAERVLWQLAIDAAGVGAFDWHLASGELRWDDRLLDIFGLSSAAFGGDIEAFNAAVHPDDRAHVGAALGSAIEQCGVYEAEYRITRPDGSLRWLSARGRALPGPDGRAARVIGAAYDTTAAVEAEASVRRVLEAMPSAFFHLDTDWRFSYLNPRAVELLGGIGSDVVGRIVWELFPAAVGSDFERHYRRAVEEQVPVQFEAWYPPPLDTWFDVQAWPTPDGLSVYFADAGDRHRAIALGEARRDRAELLSEVTEALSGTLRPDEMAARLAQVVVGSLVDWSIVSLVSPARPAGPQARWGPGSRGLSVGPVRDVASWHRDPVARETLAHYAQVRGDALTATSLPVRALVEDRHLVAAEDAAAVVERSLVEGSEARDLISSLHPSALAVFPLRGRGHTVGLLTVARTATDSPLSTSDVDTLHEVAARAGLALDNARLYAEERDLAEQLQRSLLTDPPHVEGLEMAVRYAPAARAAQVGGDWYDAFGCGDGSTVVAIGDVVGHDTAAAATMGQLRGLLRGIAVSVEAGPAGVLEKVDAAIDTLHVDTLATAVVARFGAVGPRRGTDCGSDDGESAEGWRTMVWANAGHPPPLVVTPTADGVSVSVLAEHDVLLGVETSTRRREHSCELPPGSTVVFCTDGLIERRGEPLDVGAGRLRAIVGDLVGQGLCLQEVCDGLLDGLLTSELEDDVAVIAVRLG